MFVPKISISNVPLNASSMLITDITGNTTDLVPDTTGYIHASTYYPQNKTSWHKFVHGQFLGALPSQYLYNPITDKDSTSSATVTIALADGIWLISEYWMRKSSDVSGLTLNYTIDPARTTLTRGGGTDWKDNGAAAGVFEGLYAIGKGDSTITTLDDLSVISALTTSTITLNTALNATVADSGALNMFYRAQKYALVMNEGEQSLISDIGDMAIASMSGQACNESQSCALAHRMMVKLAAQIAFNCGNYAKAHNAAILFNKSVSPNTNCISC
jgi:hypothetical protein